MNKPAEHGGEGDLDVGARQKARHYAVQALYQWILAGSSPAQIEAEFRTDYDMGDVDVPYFHDVLAGTVAQVTALDGCFVPHLDRGLHELDPVSLAQLRMSTYELKNRLDVPWRVVIEEGVRLSKKFGPTDGYKYINGVLDKVSRDLRPAETGKR